MWVLKEELNIPAVGVFSIVLLERANVDEAFAQLPHISIQAELIAL